MSTHTCNKDKWCRCGWNGCLCDLTRSDAGDGKTNFNCPECGRTITWTKVTTGPGKWGEWCREV